MGQEHCIIFVAVVLEQMLIPRFYGSNRGGKFSCFPEECANGNISAIYSSGSFSFENGGEA